MEISRRQKMISRKEYLQRYYQEHKEKIKASAKQWKNNNPDKVSGFVKKENAGEKARMRKKEYVINNPDKVSESIKRWAKNNKGSRLKNQKDYIARHPEKIMAQNMAQKIPLQKECGICKSKTGLERHHWRYDKPLLVATLCKPCHTIQHVKHFVGGNYNRR